MKRTPLRRKGRERGEPNHALRAWIRKQPCALLYWGNGCLGHTEAAHLPRVKQHGDVQNLIPLCAGHHREQHRIGIASFAEKYGLDLEALALTYWERYEEDA